MLVNAEAEVASLGEVLSLELVLLDLQATLQDVQRLLATHSHVGSDLLVTADAEATDGVPSSSHDWLLLGQVLQHAGGVRQAIARLADTAVQHHLLDADGAHVPSGLRGGRGMSGARVLTAEIALHPQTAQGTSRSAGRRSAASNHAGSMQHSDAQPKQSYMRDEPLDPATGPQQGQCSSRYSRQQQQPF